jgi:hypothetical protein
MLGVARSRGGGAAAGVTRVLALKAASKVPGCLNPHLVCEQHAVHGLADVELPPVSAGNPA